VNIIATNTDLEKGCVESNQINEGRNGKCRDSEGKKEEAADKQNERQT
jgi:hypothetical protein